MFGTDPITPRRRRRHEKGRRVLGAGSGSEGHPQRRKRHHHQPESARAHGRVPVASDEGWTGCGVTRV